MGVKEIVGVLKKRSNADYGEDFNAWFDWFMKTDGVGTKEEAAQGAIMKALD